MASILRSGKFLRCFAGLTRNVFGHSNALRDAEGGYLLQNNSPCLCSQFQNGFANNAAPSADLSLDKQLRRLDQDVRRIGRISRRDIEEVLEEIRAQRSATSSQSLMVIRCCGNLVPEEMPEVRTALVQEIWKTLNSLNVPMDISHYNALLRVYLENEHPFSPTDFLAEIESKSIEPNRVTYQRLIARYCQQGDIDGATRILEYMREKNLPVNEHVFNSLILGHSQANDLESAKGILGMMNQAGLEPSADTYTTLLCCYGRHGQLDEILKLLQECEEKEVILLDKDLLDVVYTMTVNGHGDKVGAVLDKLRMNMGFNQDAVNVILRLVNKGYEDVGLQILKKMPRGSRTDGQPIDVGSFFIRQLVKANRPVEKILSICKALQEEGLNPKALLIATEAGLSNGLVHNTLPLLKEMKNAGLPIRQHYFWPLICSAESSQVMDIIRHMQEEFSLNPNSETIRDYVIPHLKEKNWDRIIALLRDVGVPNGIAAASAACSALTNNQIKEAANIMDANRAYYPPQLFRQPLILALSKTEDYSSFIRIVRQLYESVNNRRNGLNAGSASATAGDAAGESASAGAQEQEEAEAASTDAAESIEESTFTGAPDIVGSVLFDAFSYFRTNRVVVLEKILTRLVDHGLSISNGNATRLSERLGSDMTPAISEMLGKLSSGELELKPLRTSGSKKRTLDQLTIEELERFAENLEAKGENSNNVKRHMISACFRSKNLEKTLKVFEKLEAEKFVIPTGAWAQMVDLYAHHNKTAEALELYEKLKAKESDFVLDNLKTVRIVDLLMKEDRLDDALKFLERNKKSQPFSDSEGSFNYMTTIWRLLNSVADTGDVQKLQRLFDALVAGNYAVPTNIILGPLIKVHLVRDDIQGAIDTFDKVSQKYHCTPWKNELACRLIQKEDAANLQRVTDLSTNIHGEVNSLYDLVFSFVECGRIRQARKILETPGLRTRPHRIDSACERYKNEGMVESLEGLMEATKDLNHIDRNNICYNLLLSYSKAEDANKALGLWTKMQEENLAPNDAFLLKLAELLKKKNMPIPFVVPQISGGKSEKAAQKSPDKKAPALEARAAPASQATPASQPKALSNLALMRRALTNNDIDAALEHKSKQQSSEIASRSDISHIIELLTRAGRLTEATKYAEELLSAKKFPQPKVFKFLLNKVATSGDIETIQRFGDYLDEENKRIVSYDNRLCHAIVVGGKAEQYLKRLDDEISAAKTPEDAAKLASKFPRGGALGILEKHPELVSQYEKMAEKYAALNQLGPMNVLWMHHISNHNEEVSKAIWEKYLSNAPRLMFQRVLQTAREQKDQKLAENCISQLRNSKISESAIGNAYSCLIDILIANNDTSKAMETLKTALKDVSLENINRTALTRLKTMVEEKQQQFPYTIPEKKIKYNDSLTSSSSSASSSDDDVTPKRPETIPSKPSNVKNE